VGEGHGGAMRHLALAAALGLVAACDSTGPGGLLKVELTTPNSGADGAILLTVTGPAALRSAAAGSGLRLFAQPLAATNHFALTGTLSVGTILIIGVPDVGQASAYTATIQQVATPSYQLRALAGYALTITQ